MGLPNVINNINDLQNQINTIKSTYLPLSGNVMTGVLRTKSHFGKATDDSFFDIYGGRSHKSGSQLTLFGKDYSGTIKGGFQITAYNEIDDTLHTLLGLPNKLTWLGNDVDCIQSYGNNYIQYSNGLLICYANIAGNEAGYTRWTYPIPFISSPVVATAPTGDTNCQPYVVLRGDSSTNTHLDVITKSTNNVLVAWGVMFIAIGRWK